MSTQPWILFQKLDDGTKYDEPLERSENGVMPQGSIIILKPDATPLDLNTLEITSEHHRPRNSSLNRSGSPGVASFTSRVRERDRRCCISGTLVPEDLFAPFRTSHIYPVAHTDTWNNRRLHEHILDDAPEEEQGTSQINSVQNGLLLRTDLHDLWDLYFYGVDVDMSELSRFSLTSLIDESQNDHRIIAFGPMNEYDGRRLYINSQKTPLQPVA
ncbi:hypothetical protein BDV98DRAFT_567916 [Pterulicium gracile]|uniref:HNH nuclease domain-containing protein n=1 Tax=Pterulicium gracile TaxID=1884261 RepID=A0A5C3QM91_9AGAR|nr:hypothetical protein BDV98DRAFT_567916 [Pterula gracilis]